MFLSFFKAYSIVLYREIFQVVQKEKRKLEDERSQVAALKRESQSLSEACEDVEQKRQKLAADLHSKDSHISALNGQISHLKKLLDQEAAKVHILDYAID